MDDCCCNEDPYALLYDVMLFKSVGISNKQMSCPAMAQLLSNTLYYKRFFPYYAFNVLGGLDNEGKSCVFTPLLLPAKDAVTPLSESEAVDLVKDVFASAAERDIYTVKFFWLCKSSADKGKMNGKDIGYMLLHF
ncbi:hypothetical protein MRB53_003115 [Persea americana]|uniref:Uncharacterized protein n=1 Tax=Persea americana TaxID=3435 RepID=A0ACC2MWE4_PERAE|nr:hypothetical protein MRB53_003115 [Persea americana]